MSNTKKKNHNQQGVPKTDPNFYSLKRILSFNCQYNMVIGERSNGKTYAVLKYALEQYINHGHQCAYIRRYREDLRGKRGENLFQNLVQNGVVSHLTDLEFDAVKYSAGRWYLGKFNPDLNRVAASEEPFCYGFSLTETEHDKSTAFPNVTTIIFDEFLTRQYYLPNEFVLFMNTLSTIIRHRDNVKIFMLGNTVNKYCPYFSEMGLKNVPEMLQGKIDIYNYGKSGLRVAVERCEKPEVGSKKSDVYFAFDNPELQMITGGAWEIALYPHIPIKYEKSDIVFQYFIDFNEQLLQCEIVLKDNNYFTYIHRKTTPIQDEDNDIIFSDKYDPRPNWFRNIRRGEGYFAEIPRMFARDKIFYQDNEVGEVVRNYLKYCQTEMHRL